MPTPRPAWFEVTDPDAAAVLLDWPQLRLLTPFFTTERSVGEAAETLGLDLRALHYRVQRFVHLGLLEPSGTRPRKGRPIRLYRTPAAGFHVPFGLAPDALLEEFSDAFAAPVRRALARGLQRALEQAIPDLHTWGMSITRDPERGLQYFPAPGPGDPTLFERMATDPTLPAASDRWHYLDLDHADARAFEAELQTLVTRYGERGGAQRYLVHTAVAPLVEDG